MIEDKTEIKKVAGDPIQQSGYTHVDYGYITEQGVGEGI